MFLSWTRFHETKLPDFPHFTKHFVYLNTSQTISLVIKANTDFSTETLSQVLPPSRSHPFSEVVILSSSELSKTGDDYASVSVGASIVNQKQTSSSEMNICDVQVSTDWFVITDDKHSIIDDMRILVTPDGSKRPLQAFVPSNMKSCQESTVCRETVALGNKLFPSMNSYVLSGDALFHRSLRDEFCRYVREMQSDEINDEPHIIQDVFIRGGIASDSIMATRYFAFLYKNGYADSTYVMMNKAKIGVKNNFKRRVEVPRSIRTNLVDIILPRDNSKEGNGENAIPMFWHIPKVRILLSFHSKRRGIMKLIPSSSSTTSV